jgi:hypothetical protein
MPKQKAIVDGSNAAYLQAPREPRANIRNISAVAKAVEKSGRDPIIIFDPSIRSLLVDADEFEQLMSDPRVITVADGKDINQLILETAEKLDALIISNNTYIDYYEDYPWIEGRRIPVAMVDGSVLLLETKLKRAS